MFKIAMVVFSHYPLDVRVRREAEALAAAGICVDVICLRGDGEADCHRINGVTAHRISLKRKRAGKMRYLWEYGCFLILSFLRLSLLHFRNRYKIVHIHNLPDILVLSALVPKLTGAKIILDMHESMPEFYMRKFGISQNRWMIRIIKLAEKFSVNFADHVIAATPFIKEKLVGRAVHSDKCTVILNLPDIRYFRGSSSRAHRADGTFNVIYPGTLSEIHGVDVAIRAMKLVCREISASIRFHIYGSGSAEASLKQLVKSLQLEEVVFFHPLVPLEKLAEILEVMDAGIVPKRDGLFSGEAISTKLFDFAATGIPGIVSRTRGDSLFFDDSMVLFFEPENAWELADCILRLYRNPGLRLRLAANAKTVIRKMNWEILKQDLYRIYETLSDGAGMRSLSHPIAGKAERKVLAL